MSLTSLFIALIATAVTLRVMHPIAVLVDLIDKPCNRKQHAGSVPLIGGIAVFAGVAVAISYNFEFALTDRLYLVSSAMMVFIGMLDDKYSLSVKVRLVGQIIAASVIIFGGDMYIQSLGNLIGLGHVELGQWGILFTCLAVLAAMNAYNMIDGIDGLLGAMGLIAFLTIAALAAINQDISLANKALVASAALVPFLVCNLNVKKRWRKVFMGDAGSMFVGLTIVWLLIQATQSDYSQGLETNPVTSLWVVAVPIMDMVTIMVRRTKNGLSPTTPGRDHIHHYYLNAGFTPRQTLVILSTIATLFAAVGIFLDYAGVPAWGSLIIFLLSYSVYCKQFAWLKKRVAQQ